MKNFRNRSEIIIPPEPLHLRTGIPVHDIAFLILEVPGNYNQDIPFPDPDFLFYLSLDPAHPCNAIVTADADMVCPHHQFSRTKHLPVPFLGEFHPDNLITGWACTRSISRQYNLSFSRLCLCFGA
jgi:hypothetical protein